jgi:hypothetical protein
MTRLLVAVYLIETGLLLMVSPWTEWWRTNYFAETVPAVRWFMVSRGAWMIVVTTGAITMVTGAADLYVAFIRRARRAASAAASQPTSTLDA